MERRGHMSGTGRVCLCGTARAHERGPAGPIGRNGAGPRARWGGASGAGGPENGRLAGGLRAGAGRSAGDRVEGVGCVLQDDEELPTDVPADCEGSNGAESEDCAHDFLLEVDLRAAFAARPRLTYFTHGFLKPASRSSL